MVFASTLAVYQMMIYDNGYGEELWEMFCEYIIYINVAGITKCKIYK